MSKEAKIVFENRLKMKLNDRFTECQEDFIFEAIQECLSGLSLEIGSVEERSSEELLKSYINAMAIQGRSEKTIARYEYVIKRLINWSDVPIQDFTIMNIRAYLGSEKDRGISNETLESTRQVFSAFFGWLHREGLILHNPVVNLGPIKGTKKIKTTYSDIDIEKLKQKAKNIRDKAIICFLLSTGCRISEVTQLNRTDINIPTQECKVLGKGNKERTVYFDAVSRLTLEQYLNQRDDDDEALFVDIRPPHERIKPGGVRIMLKKLEEETGVDHVHPHKFRRTRATRLVKHGMPIQEVAAILGHEKLDTTMKYVVLDQQDIKSAYQKYV